MLWYILGGVLLVVGQIVINWFIYKGRKSAQPDQDNSAIITGPEDAIAQRIIDHAHSSKDD